jgi:hypothetical protein
MRKAIFLICMVQLLAAGSLWAQATTGSFVGSVTDPSDAIIVDAQVAATNQATGVAYSSSTDEHGNFSILHVPPGTYSVKASKAGFEVTSMRDVVLYIDQKQLLNFKLTVGKVSESITISVTSTGLQTQSMETSEVITTQDILDLPLLGRNFLDLTTLSAGVVSGAHGVNSFDISVNGQREYANSIMIDGVEATTNRTQDITLTPSVDSVQEFKILTSAYSAEYGHAAGGVVSIQTKSGSNSLHGSAYEFYRPNFGAARPFSISGAKEPASDLDQNNFGGTVGGPIRKDKSFFFVSYERTQQRNAYSAVTSVPPKGEITVLPNGDVDLSKFYDCGCAPNEIGTGPGKGPQLLTVYNPFLPGQPQFESNGVLNVIPAAYVSKAGLATLENFFPSPNLPGKPGTNGWDVNFAEFVPTNFNGNLGDARYDHNFSDKDRLSVIYHYGDSNQLENGIYYGHTVVPNGGDNDFGNNEVLRNQGVSVSEYHTFNSRIVNEARFGYTRLREDLFSLMNGKDYSTQYGAQNVHVPGFPATDGFPYIELVGGKNEGVFFTGGSTYKPFLELDSNFQFTDNVTIISGKHEIKFGGDFRRLNSNPNFSLLPTGFQYYAYGTGYSATANSNFQGGSVIGDLLIGIPYVQDIGLQLTHPHTQAWELDNFVEDTYRLSPKLTLYGGIRYEFQSPWSEASNNMSNYNPATDSLLLAGRGGNSRGLLNTNPHNFGPRLGISYQINPTTVIRAGYGFFYSPENDGKEDYLTKNYPFAIQNSYCDGCYFPYGAPSGGYPYTFDAGVPRQTNPIIPAGASSIPTSAIASVQSGTENTYYEDPHMKTGYSQSYNLTLQKQVPYGVMLEIAYVGSVSHDLSYLVGDINNVNGNSNILTKNLTHIQALYSRGWAEYNSLQGKVTKRASKNLSFLATYTYGHNIDNGPAPFNLNQGYNSPQNPYNLSAEIASADDDIRHTFTFSGLYRFPIGRGQALFGNWGDMHELILGGWQINAIFRAQTGTPFNVTSGLGNSSCPGVRPDLVPGQRLWGPQTLAEYFNTAAFTAPAGSTTNPCAFGDAGRNILYGPGFVNADFSLFKEFAFKERGKLQTRFEVFNLSNSPHFQNPNGVLNSGSFGQITNTYGNMRILQLAAKIIF